MSRSIVAIGRQLPDEAEIGSVLASQGPAIALMLGTVQQLLGDWAARITDVLAENPDLLADPMWWQLYANQELYAPLRGTMELAIREAIGLSGIPVSWGTINQRVRDLAGEMAFEMVNLSNPRGIVRPRAGFLEGLRADLVSGALNWSDLPSALEGMFGEYRARLIARTETTGLWAKSHLLAAAEAGVGFKRNVRAELHRPCPSNVCPDAQDEGWIPLGQAFRLSGLQGPHFHPHCYCYLQFSYSGEE